MQGELDYDETVDVLTNVEDKEAPPPMHRVSLSQAVQVIVEQWSRAQQGSVVISREGPDITSMQRFSRSTIEKTSLDLGNPARAAHQLRRSSQCAENGIRAAITRALDQRRLGGEESAAYPA